ncbi:MAG: hypothetical protein LUQ30_03710, partial [Methanothrix sp.]|nr:hypothetical protein [Methanothrix sp.]
REVCPVCGSSDLYLEAGGYTGNLYRCKSCDYMGGPDSGGRRGDGQGHTRGLPGKEDHLGPG